MHLITQKNIEKFLACRNIAIVGASRNKKSFSAEVGSHLQKLGYQLHFINPAFATDAPDDKHLADIGQLPSQVDALLILTAPTRTAHIVDAAICKGIKNIWIQQMSDTPSAIEAALKANVNIIHHHCIFMFTSPVGIHKFHYRIKKIFGGLPQ